MLLVSAEQQGESAACIHTALPSSASLPPHPLIPPLKVITEHWAELPVLCSSFPLAVFFFKRGSVYMIMLLSQSIPLLPLAMSTSVFSTSASLFLPCK